VGYEASTTATSRSRKCSASHSVDLSQRLGGDGAGFGSVRSIISVLGSMDNAGVTAKFIRKEY
jgi:hypothetical protein